MYKTRVIRAKACSNKPVTCLYLNRERFNDFMSHQEIGIYIDRCKEYTDWDKEGKDLMSECLSTKQKIN